MNHGYKELSLNNEIVQCRKKKPYNSFSKNALFLSSQRTTLYINKSILTTFLSHKNKTLFYKYLMGTHILERQKDIFV